MKNALLLHGTSGSHASNWLPWLKKELGMQGYKVWLPDLPKANRPRMSRYNKFIFKNWEFDKDSIIIAHSSGAAATLGVLQAIPQDIKIKKAILVAGFKDDLGWVETKNLFDIDLDFAKIQNQAQEIILIHSDNDSYVPLSHAEFLKEKLNAKLKVIKSQKHFSISTMGKSYSQFPNLLDYIK